MHSVILQEIESWPEFSGILRQVSTGGSSYDFLSKEQSPWAYGDQRVIVVTSRPLDDPKGTLEVRSDVDALISELRALDDGDVWMLGGGRLQMAFMERGALDEIEIYLIPEIIGSGQPLFPLTGFRASPTLISATAIKRLCTTPLPNMTGIISSAVSSGTCSQAHCGSRPFLRRSAKACNWKSSAASSWPVGAELLLAPQGPAYRRHQRRVRVGDDDIFRQDCRQPSVRGLFRQFGGLDR